MKRIVLPFLLALAACTSNGEGSTKPVEMLVGLIDARAWLQALPDGRWEMSLKCTTSDGKAGTMFSRGVWTAATTEQVKEYTHDPAVRAFASQLFGNDTCPQGDTDVFEMLLPTNELLCWRSDPSNPMMPASILRLEKEFDDIVTATQAAGRSCSPVQPATEPKINFGSRSSGNTSGGTPPVPAAGAPAPRP